MNRVHYGWIFNKVDGTSSDGRQLYKATRTRSGNHNEPKKETIIRPETDLIEIINRIAEKEARDDGHEDIHTGER